MNKKNYRQLLWGIGVVSLAVILTLFIVSQTYIQNLVYHERLSQMEEVTHQMFRSLEDVIDNHWDDVDVQCNYLAYMPMETTDDLFSYLEKLSELSNYKEKQIELIAVDSAGHYYTEHGRMGLLRGMSYLESAPERVSYVSNSLTEDDSRMVFLKQLPTPITLQSGEKEITLRYFGISQCMTQLNDYFRCDAYENNNSVYVLDNNGFKLFNANETELLKGHNVYTVLSQMSYLHGSSFAEAKERLDRIIRQQAGQRRQTFTVNTHLQHENVLADPNRLNQVLMNILSNAVKYTPTGGHIRFEVDELPRNEHYVRYRFVVQDDGIGMSEAYQKTLFDPFTREEHSGTNKVQGTGLGMAITKNIVDPLSRIIPTLAMTANAFLEDMQKSREAGMDKRVSAEEAHKRCK